MSRYENDKNYSPYRILNQDLVIPYWFSKAAMYTDEEQKLERAQGSEPSDPKTWNEFWARYGMKIQDNVLNTERVKQKVETMVGQNTDGAIIPLVTVVCPPYEMTQLGKRNNLGLFKDINEDPLRHNFLYSYKLQAYTLGKTADFLEGQGVKVQPTWVIGDWGLRDSREPGRRYDDTAEATRATLDAFAISTREYFDNYFGPGRVEVDRFSSLRISKIYPLAMPQGPIKKQEWVLDNLDKITQLLADKPETSTLAQALPEIVKQYQNCSGKFIQYTNPKSWSEFSPGGEDSSEGSKEMKRVWIKFFQILRNTIASRCSEAGVGFGEGSSLNEGFWDAVIKAQEYAVYGQVLTEKYPNQISAYFDTKYPAAGLFFEEGGMNLMYLDTRKFNVPMDKLGITVNPF